MLTVIFLVSAGKKTKKPGCTTNNVATNTGVEIIGGDGGWHCIDDVCEGCVDRDIRIDGKKCTCGDGSACLPKEEVLKLRGESDVPASPDVPEMPEMPEMPDMPESSTSTSAPASPSVESPTPMVSPSPQSSPSSSGSMVALGAAFVAGAMVILV